jgi:lysophospholipid acyltransferase (LPLAT)-like uncharacterized protein
MAATNPQSNGVVVPHKPKWHQRLGAFIVFAALRAVLATVRYRLGNHSEYFGPQTKSDARDFPTRQVIYCLWHNRLASCIQAYDRFGRPRSPAASIAALVSASKDGALLAAILECFKLQPVRGSSSRRGSQALLELTSWAKQGYDLAITPDGPRGPCYQLQDGILALAQITGLPVLPVSFNLNWKIRLGSWDRFQIPLPFARCEVFVGDVIRVPRDVTDGQRAELRQELERRLKEITRD